MDDAELVAAVAQLDSALMRPLFVSRMARTLLNHPSDRIQRGARTRVLKASQEVERVVLEWTRKRS